MNTKLFGAVNDVEETYGVIVNFNGVTPLQLLAVQGDVTDVIADRTNSYCAMNETTFDECCAGFGDRCGLLNVELQSTGVESIKMLAANIFSFHCDIILAMNKFLNAVVCKIHGPIVDCYSLALCT